MCMAFSISAGLMEYSANPSHLRRHQYQKQSATNFSLSSAFSVKSSLSNKCLNRPKYLARLFNLPASSIKSLGTSAILRSFTFAQNQRTICVALICIKHRFGIFNGLFKHLNIPHTDRQLSLAQIILVIRTL